MRNKNISSEGQSNCNTLITLLRSRLHDNGKSKSSDTNGNVIYVDCDLYTKEMLESFLDLAVSEFNATPDFTDTIIGRGYDAAFNLNYYIDCRTTFQVGSYKGSPVADQFVTSSTTTASRIGLWTNVVAYRTTDYKVGVYINGVRENEVTYTLADFSSTSVNSTINLGALNQNGTMARFLNAQIASSQLYNRALSSSEVLQNFNAQKSRFNL